jgi:hypothetical protein
LKKPSFGVKLYFEKKKIVFIVRLSIIYTIIYYFVKFLIMIFIVSCSLFYFINLLILIYNAFTIMIMLKIKLFID